MTRQKSAKSESTPTSARPPQDKRDKRNAGRDWADDAAQARASDDPRRVAPHDQSGVPSTGDRY
ncbi:hypothetical protein BDK92_4246 [Micromonospora pisi]|uniref:Uncharacterized protein n=1 Tax=Micromonospora pisi TaxID=589240 RepID=A0A495JLP1_9ACTN|nr:hypothetical protein [Micromonospora pisi]RKR89887.1 hypothetical protein BDK92_4246 [Micromonospora pisi]